MIFQKEQNQNKELLNRIARYGIGEELPPKEEVEELKKETFLFLMPHLFWGRTGPRLSFTKEVGEAIQAHQDALLKIASFWCNLVGLSSYKQVLLKHPFRDYFVKYDAPEKEWFETLPKVAKRSILVHLSGKVDKPMSPQKTKVWLLKWGFVLIKSFCFEKEQYISEAARIRQMQDDATNMFIVFSKLSMLPDVVKEWEKERSN